MSEEQLNVAPLATEPSVVHSIQDPITNDSIDPNNEVKPKKKKKKKKKKNKSANATTVEETNGVEDDENEDDGPENTQNVNELGTEDKSPTDLESESAIPYLVPSSVIADEKSEQNGQQFPEILEQPEDKISVDQNTSQTEDVTPDHNHNNTILPAIANDDDIEEIEPIVEPISEESSDLFASTESESLPWEEKNVSTGIPLDSSPLEFESTTENFAEEDNTVTEATSQTLCGEAHQESEEAATIPDLVNTIDTNDVISKEEAETSADILSQKPEVATGEIFATETSPSSSLPWDQNVESIDFKETLSQPNSRTEINPIDPSHSIISEISEKIVQVESNVEEPAVPAKLEPASQQILENQSENQTPAEVDVKTVSSIQEPFSTEPIVTQQGDSLFDVKENVELPWVEKATTESKTEDEANPNGTDLYASSDPLIEKNIDIQSSDIKQFESTNDLFSTNETKEPLPWESNNSVHQDNPAIDSTDDNNTTDLVSQKLASLDLSNNNSIEDRETATKTEEVDLFGAAPGDDFANLIQNSTVKSPTTSKEKIPDKKFAFLDLDLDDDLLDEEFLDETPSSNSTLVQPQHSHDNVKQFKYQPQVADRVNSNAPKSYSHYAHIQEPSQSQHHLDIQKLNENKKKSDAYDFPVNLIQPKLNQKPSRTFSPAQSQFRAPSVGSPIPSQPIAPPTHFGGQHQQSNSPLNPPQNLRRSSITSNNSNNSSVPPKVAKKKPSSFFEELPILTPVHAAKPVRTAGPTIVNPLINSANNTSVAAQPLPINPYGPPQQGSNISKPPIRPPSAMRYSQPNVANSSPSFSELPPIAPSTQAYSQYGPASITSDVSNQPQANSAQAPPQTRTASFSRYAPTIPPQSTSTGPQLPPQTGQQFPNQANAGYPTGSHTTQVQALPPQIVQPPVSQPQLSPLLKQVAPGKYGPVATAPVGNQPSGLTLGIPSSNIKGDALKSPSQSVTSPNVSRYAPINHKRQASSTANQYDPYSIAKLQNHQRQVSSSNTQYQAPASQQQQVPYGQQPQQQQIPQGEQPQLQPVPYGQPPQQQHVPYGQPSQQPYQQYQAQQPQQPQQTASINNSQPLHPIPDNLSGAGAQALPYQQLHSHPATHPYPAAPQQATPASVVQAPVRDPESLRYRQYPLFSWGSGMQVAYYIPGTTYQASTGIKISDSDTILKEQILKEFPVPTKKNLPQIEKFLDKRIEVLSSSPNTGTDLHELLLAQVFKHKASKSSVPFDLGGRIVYNESNQKQFHLNDGNLPKISKRQLVSLISSGQKEQAISLAVEHHDYALALLISSSIDKNAWVNTVEKYLQNEFSGDNNSFLFILFGILSGDSAAVIDFFRKDPIRGRWAVDNWKELATAVVLNSPQSLKSFLSDFGLFLFENDLVVPGFILFILGDLPLPVKFQGITSVKFVLYQEIHGLVLQEHGISFDATVIHLQQAFNLLDYSLSSEAQKYLDLASSSIKTSKIPSPSLKYSYDSLNERLSETSNIEGGWFGRPKLDKVWGQLDKSLNKFISGDEIKSNSSESGVFSKFSPNVSRTASLVSLSSAVKSNEIKPLQRSSTSGPIVRHKNSYTPGSAYDFSQAQSVKQDKLRAFASQSHANILESVSTHTPPAIGRKTSIPAFAPPPKIGSQHGYVSPKLPKADLNSSYSPNSRTSRYSNVEQSSRRPSIQSRGSYSGELTFNAKGPYAPKTFDSTKPPSGVVVPPKSSRSYSITSQSSNKNSPQQPLLPPAHRASNSAHSSEVSSRDSSFIEEKEGALADEDAEDEQAFDLRSNSVSQSTLHAETTVDTLDHTSQEQSGPESEDRIEAPHHSNGIETPVSRYNKTYDDYQYVGQNRDFSVSMSDFGSSTATPYHVPAYSSDSEEHEGYQGSQRKDLDSESPRTRRISPPQSPALSQASVPGTAPPLAPETGLPASTPSTRNPYAPPAAATGSDSQHGSLPTSQRTTPKKSASASRFTPKSYALPSEPAVAPVTNGDVDYYSFGYQHSEPIANPSDSNGNGVVHQKFTGQEPVTQKDTGTVKQVQLKKEEKTFDDGYTTKAKQKEAQPPVANPYVPVIPSGPVPLRSPNEAKFSPYQPTDSTGDTLKQGQQFITSPKVDTGSKFEPYREPSFSVPSTSGANTLNTRAYEPPTTNHNITQILEEDEEYYDDVVEDSDDEDEDEDNKNKQHGGEETDSRKSKETKKKQAKKDNSSDADSGSSWFTWLRKDTKGPKVYRAKLGEENKFYYDENLKRWVNKDANPEDLKAAAAPPPPPVIKKKPSTLTRPRVNSLSGDSGPPGPSPVSPSQPPSGLNPAGVPPPSGGPNPSKPSTLPPKAKGPPGASDLDSLIGLSAGGASTRRKKRGGRGYVDVMGSLGDKK